MCFNKGNFTKKKKAQEIISPQLKIKLGKEQEDLKNTKQMTGHGYKQIDMRKVWVLLFVRYQ